MSTLKEPKQVFIADPSAVAFIAGLIEGLDKVSQNEVCCRVLREKLMDVTHQALGTLAASAPQFPQRNISLDGRIFVYMTGTLNHSSGQNDWAYIWRINLDSGVISGGKVE